MDMADTSGYGCESDCVYQNDGQPSSNACFKTGDLAVECYGKQKTSHYSCHLILWGGGFPVSQTAQMFSYINITSTGHMSWVKQELNQEV